MPLGLQQQDSDLAFAQSTTTSGGSTTAASDFAPSPEHRHAAWTGRRSESRNSASLAKEQNMTAQDVDVEAEGRPPYLHVRSNHKCILGRTAERIRPVRLQIALTWDFNDRP
jgi:hypothetical protein